MFFVNGVQAGSAQVGQAITYDIPGYSQIWLYELKDGQQNFNGPFSVPMQPYTLTPNDVGHYQVFAYTLVGQTYGSLIESTTFDVVAAGAVVGGLTGSNLLLYGGLALVAYMLIKR